MSAKSVLFSLLRAAVCGEAITEETKRACTPDTLKAIYTIAKRHDLTHLVWYAVSGLGLPESKPLVKCKYAAMQALMYYMQLNSTYEQLCKTLEDGCIPFIPLKGSVLRNYYPEPWLRTSCDIDILVNEDTLDAVANLLVEKLNYIRKVQSDYDITMFAPNGVHLELHYRTMNERQQPKAYAVLEDIWCKATPVAPKRFHYCMSDEMLYSYHIAHMAKHFQNGGCGIRPFLDLWILNHRVEHDQNKRKSILSQCELLTFAQAAEKLSEVWFSNAQKDTLSEQMEQFILYGGAYGNLPNHLSVQQAKKGGKLQCILSKVFLPYDRLKFHYPILQKNRWLTPVYEVRRWIRLIFTKGIKRSIHTLKVNADISAEQLSSATELLKALGL